MGYGGPALPHSAGACRRPVKEGRKHLAEAYQIHWGPRKINAFCGVEIAAGRSVFTIFTQKTVKNNW